MPRIYGYMDTDTNVFTPAGQEVQYNPPQGQVAYSAYNQQPQGQQWQGQGYRANTGRQRQYQQWQGNGYRVNVGQPRFTGNGYAPRGYNTNMNYGPWYGQQSYATYPPYAPNQPRYEWMPSSGGGIVPVQMGEWQRQQPVAYEMMYNSQGIPVRVPVYAPMNNSAMPVRVGVSPDGQPYGSANVNYQAATPQQSTQQRTAPRVRSMPEPVATQALYRTPDWNDRMTDDWQRATAAERKNDRVLALPEDINYRRLLGSDPARYDLAKVNDYLLKNYDTVDKLEELLNNGSLPSDVLPGFLLPQYGLEDIR